MSLSPELQQRLEALTKSDRVVLFMKGNRQQPRCGFSATVAGMLDEMLPAYATVDVLADQDIREGIKIFSDWPTIPQLYIDGELVGGCDIAKDLHASGQLHAMLGLERPPAPTAKVTLTAAAADALRGARDGEEPDHRFLRISVNAHFQHGLSFGPELPGDVASSCEGIEIRVDAASAKRADGLVIDYVTSPQTGFRIENPNEPARVKQISVEDMKARLEAATAPVKFYDVRGKDEWDIAHIEKATLLTDDVAAGVLTLPKDTPLYFHCHHGGRSQTAAERFLREGFTHVFNVEGGIDAWSQRIDTKIPRY